MKRIRVLMAEDHALMRAGIRALLRDISDIEIVAEASDGREAVSLARQHRPDVVLMDIAMRELNGLEATAHIVRDLPEARVLILSMHATETYVREALRAGAKGYVVKDAGIEEVEKAIRSAVRGEVYLSPAVSGYVVTDYLRRLSGKAEPEPSGELTRRQKEVLQLIAEGRTTKEIADILNVSVKTVETHRSRLMDALDIHDIAGLVRYAIRMGFVTLEG